MMPPAGSTCITSSYGSSKVRRKFLIATLTIELTLAGRLSIYDGQVNLLDTW
jgi:hypothetical protein